MLKTSSSSRDSELSPLELARHALWLLLLAAVAQPSVGEEPPELVTDRPDQTESAIVVPVGTFQLETGWITSRHKDGGVETTTTGAPDTLLRIGLAERWELRLGWSGEQEVKTRAAGFEETVRGAGDTSVGFKYRLRDETGRSPEMAILAGINLPTGSRGLSSDRSDPSVLLSFANTLSESTSLGYNLGLAQESERAESGEVEKQTFLTYSAAVGFGLSPRVGAFTEAFGAFSRSSDAEDSHSVDAGLTFLLRPHLQLDLAAGVGLNSAADDYFVLAGFSLRLPE